MEHALKRPCRSGGAEALCSSPRPSLVPGRRTLSVESAHSSLREHLRCFLRTSRDQPDFSSRFPNSGKGSGAYKTPFCRWKIQACTPGPPVPRSGHFCAQLHGVGLRQSRSTQSSLARSVEFDSVAAHSNSWTGAHVQLKFIKWDRTSGIDSVPELAFHFGGGRPGKNAALGSSV